jgi:hypothetical protein
MAQPPSSPDFDALTWHDNALYGLRLDVGDCTRGDWHADLVLDIDHIVEWLCGTDRQVRFRVAPATLTFHDVTDLRIAIDCGDSGGQIALHPLSIAAITPRANRRSENLPRSAVLSLAHRAELAAGRRHHVRSERLHPDPARRAHRARSAAAFARGSDQGRPAESVDRAPLRPTRPGCAGFGQPEKSK